MAFEELFTVLRTPCRRTAAQGRILKKQWSASKGSQRVQKDEWNEPRKAIAD